MRESEERYRELVENGQGLICTHDLNGKLLSVNPAAAQTLGYAPSEMVGNNLVEFLSPSVQPDFDRYLKLIAAEPSVNGLMNLITKEGEERVWAYRNARIEGQGKTEYVLGHAQDITERKHAEEELRESEERYRLLFESNPQPMWVYDLETLAFLAVNESAVNHYGYSREEFLAMTIKDIRPAEDIPALYDSINSSSKAVGATGIWRHLKKDGTIFDVEITSHLLVFDDRRAELILAHDITERRRAEAERQVISEIVQGVITTANLDELFKLAHKAISKLLYAENLFIALDDPTTGLMHFEFWVDKFDPIPLPRPASKGFSGYVLRTGQPLMLSEELKTELSKRGEVERTGTASASWLGVPLRTHSRTIGVLVVQHYEKKNAYSQQDREFLAAVGDQLGLAVERKQIELELKTNEMRLNEAQHIANLGNWEWDVLTNKVRWSNELYRIFGLQPQTPGSTFGKFLTYVHPDDRKVAERAIEQALHENVFPDCDYRIIRPDGTVRVVQCKGEVVVDETGRVTSLWGTLQDITERMQVENALRQSEEKYRELIENANDIIYTLDLSGGFTSLNRAGERITGYTREEALRMNIADVIGPDDAERVRQRIAKNLAGADLPEFELEIFAKDGSGVTLEISSRLILQDGVVVGIQGIGRDITERKRAEAELTKRESDISGSAGIAHLGSWEYDAVTGEVKWSDELWRIFGLDQREFGLSFEEYLAMVHPDDQRREKR